MEKEKYNPRRIEAKWQKIWEEKKSFKTEIDPERPKYYILDMFPYPSGAGLHVGHVAGYTGTDIVARYKRQKGYNVLHPMGWDSFGLPAEQYAIKTGTHPAVTTANNIATYKRQLQSLGFSYDWEREMKTSDPSYYKWTQWIFTELFKKGLAYEANIYVNFCPKLGTVLANEEIQEGKSIEGGYPVEKRPVRQWVLKITAYAERLLKDLEDLNWPEAVKKLQRNWIGKREGVSLSFLEENSQENIEVFTTRIDTLMGATYLGLSPEHPLTLKITSSEQKKEVETYVKKALSEDELKRQAVDWEKTGVFTGSYAVHPINREKIPIWIADYILPDYGTGAVMGVPSHDERDFAFAKKYELPLIATYEPSKKELREKFIRGEICFSGEGKLINSDSKKLSLNGLHREEATEKLVHFLEKEKLGKRKIQYKLRDWLFSRQRYWGEPIPVLHLEDGSQRVLEIDELPLFPPEVSEYSPSETGESPLAKVKGWVEITDSLTQKKAKRETNTMPQWAGSCWYYLRFLDPNNEEEPFSQKAENYWMPVDLYVGGLEHAVLHLLYARFWHKVLYDIGVVHTKEPFSSYKNQGIVTSRSFRKPTGEYLPIEKVEEKKGDFFEKGTKTLLFSQIEKMSKSKLNGVNPDEMIEEFGADSLRLYGMFMGPFNKEKVWNSDAVGGCFRFLTRFFALLDPSKIIEEEEKVGMKLAFSLAKTLREEIEQMQFNTAIAHMMEFINEFSSLKKYPKKALSVAVQTLYPFAPHIAEEMWERLGNKESLTFVPLIPIEEVFLQEKETLYIIQINGKFRGKLSLAKGKTQEEVFSLAKKEPNVARFLGKEPEKIIFVQDKLLNIVV